MRLATLKMLIEIHHQLSSKITEASFILLKRGPQYDEPKLSNKSCRNNRHSYKTLGNYCYQRRLNFSNSFTVIFILIMLISLFSESSQKPINSNNGNKPRTYCGSELSNVIREVCGGRYADPTKRFRRDTPDTFRIVDLCCHRPCGRETMIEFCDISITRPVNEENKSKQTVPQYPAQVSSDADLNSSEKSGRESILVQSPSNKSAPKHTDNNSDIRNNRSDDLHDNATSHTRNKVRKKNKRKRANKKKGRSCRCRKMKRRVKVSSKEVFCVPCNKICRNVNKSPMKCEKIANAFEIGTVSSAESNPHLIHDISSRSYIDNTYVTRSRAPNNFHES